MKPHKSHHNHLMMNCYYIPQKNIPKLVRFTNHFFGVAHVKLPACNEKTSVTFLTKNIEKSDSNIDQIMIWIKLFIPVMLCFWCIHLAQHGLDDLMTWWPFTFHTPTFSSSNPPTTGCPPAWLCATSPRNRHQHHPTPRDGPKGPRKVGCNNFRGPFLSGYEGQLTTQLLWGVIS